MKLYFASLLLILSQGAQAGSLGDNLPGFIPLKPGTNHAASDLILNGKQISADEADIVAKKTDISLLEPRSDTDIYPGKYSVSEVLPFQSDTPVRFLDATPSIRGRYIFAVTQVTKERESEFSVLLGVTIRNILYQKKLLEKIGYHIPPASRIPALTVSFDSSITRDRFLKQIYDSTLADSARWAKAQGEKEALLQDAVIMETSQNKMYNLSLGILPMDRILDRRTLRALAVSYELLNVPESINYFSWNFAAVKSNHIHLTFEYGDQFVGNYEDSRWMARKISRLSRGDFAEIAAAGGAPEEVQALFTEKLISRRNDLIRLFKIDAAPLKMNSKISMGKALVNGQLTASNWPGYGTFFSEGPSTDSPFTSEQLSNFFLGKGIANLIANGVSYFNTKVIPQANVSQAVLEKQVMAIAKQFVTYMKTGQLVKIPLSAFFVPDPSGNLIASRDIVIGSYMGTENLVQLADTVGVNLSMGAYIGVLGVSAPWNISGGVKASITRTYTHLRPVSNIKAALKFPLKNMMVPYFQQSIATLIDGLKPSVDGKPPSAEDQANIKKVVSKMSELLLPNESIIITDTVGPEFGVNVGTPLGTTSAVAIAGFTARQMVLGRVHITRAADDEIQIYRDLGFGGNISFAVGIQDFIPLITVHADSSQGTTKSKLYRVNIDPRPEANPDVIRNLRALSKVLTGQHFEAISVLQQPVVLESKYYQDHLGLDVLFFKTGVLDSDLFIQASKKNEAGNEKIQIMHSNFQKMHGNDFQSLALSLANATISQRTGSQTFGISSAGNGRPSDSIYGSSVVHQVTMDGIVRNAKGAIASIDSPYITLKTDWAGWKVSKEGADKILRDISKIVGKPLYAPTIFQNTKSLQLYDISFYINIYEEGITHFLALSAKDVQKILDPEKTAQNPSLSFPSEGSPPTNEIDVLLYEVYRDLAQAKEAKKNGQIATMAHNIMKAAETVEMSAGFKKLAMLFGGEQNLIAGSYINGFRDGEERAKDTLLGNTVGELGNDHYFGSSQYFGPAEALRSNIGATGSEFYMQWIMGRL